MALAALETGGDDVGPLLADADRAIAALEPPLTRLRLRWLAAQVAGRRDRRWAAMRRLLRVLGGFLHLHEDYDASRVLLDLLTLCPQPQWKKILARPKLQRAFAILSASPQLHRRARNVMAYLPYVLQAPSPYAAQALVNAGRYLEDSRHLPALPFPPTHSEPLVFLDWDELAPTLRRTICREAGADEAAGDLPARKLDTDLQELISWRYEILQRA